MADNNKKNGLDLKTALIILGIIGGPLAVWGEAQLERGSTKEKISTIERRQQEDRDTSHADQREIKQDIKEVKSDVQTILRKLEGMEAVQRAQRRERNGP